MVASGKAWKEAGGLPDVDRAEAICYRLPFVIQPAEYRHARPHSIRPILVEPSGVGVPDVASDGSMERPHGVRV
ncbi:MAG: hypothetical protein ACREI3_09735, partial [Nitrospirales bacterium]